MTNKRNCYDEIVNYKREHQNKNITIIPKIYGDGKLLFAYWNRHESDNVWLVRIDSNILDEHDMADIVKDYIINKYGCYDDYDFMNWVEDEHNIKLEMSDNKWFYKYESERDDFLLSRGNGELYVGEQSFSWDEVEN